MAKAHYMKWLGDGSKHVPGVPMTDLSPEEWDEFVERYPDLPDYGLWAQRTGSKPGTEDAPEAEASHGDAAPLFTSAPSVTPGEA